MCSGESDEFFLCVNDGSSQGGNDGVEAAIIIMAIVRCGDVGVGGNVAREDFDALMLEMGNVVGFVGECVSGSEDCDGAEVVFVSEDGVGDVCSDESRGSEDENVLVGHIEARVVTVVGLAFRRRFYEYEFTRLLSRNRRIGVLGVD